MQNKFSDAQLAHAYDALLRSMPEKSKLHLQTEENSEWLASAVALVSSTSLNGASFAHNIEMLYIPGMNQQRFIEKVVFTLKCYRQEYLLKSIGPTTLAFDSGRQFDYFDEIRKIIESASSDILIVDPYLGAEFIAKYLPHVRPGVLVRLLVQNKVAQVRSAAEAYIEQYSTNIEVRKSADLHDRYIFVDGQACYQSGATFKDGAAKSPTTLTQIVDAFSAVLATYETAWQGATQPPANS